MAGSFYPAEPRRLRALVGRLLADAGAPRRPARGVVVPHAGLLYSGACAARVFGQVECPREVVVLAPNHTGYLEAPGGASAWMRGAFATPLGDVALAEDLLAALAAACPLVAHDAAAHAEEHAIEVELPFLQVIGPAGGIALAPLVLAWDDWARCDQLAAALASVLTGRKERVLLVASSDMTHYESAAQAEPKDRLALAAMERLDGRELLAICRRERVTMCGRAPAAVVLEATRRLGATRAEVVDYRHSGMVTGDDSSVVAYAGVVIP